MLTYVAVGLLALSGAHAGRTAPMALLEGADELVNDPTVIESVNGACASVVSFGYLVWEDGKNEMWLRA